VNRELAAVRKIFSWCLEGDLIEVNPATGVRDPAAETSRDRVLSDDELRLVWAAAQAEGGTFGSLLRLLILTACRRREVSHARWAEFDVPGRMWTLPGARTKNARVHAIPLSDAALAVFAEIKRIPGADHVFGLGGRSGFSGYSKAKGRIDTRIAKLNEGKPIAAWGLHDIRRTVATRLVDLGTAPHVVEEILNHASGKSRVASIYNRSKLEPEKREALERWAEYVDRLVDPAAAPTARVA
jgi:integrase